MGERENNLIRIPLCVFSSLQPSSFSLPSHVRLKQPTKRQTSRQTPSTRSPPLSPPLRRPRPISSPKRAPVLVSGGGADDDDEQSTTSAEERNATTRLWSVPPRVTSVSARPRNVPAKSVPARSAPAKHGSVPARNAPARSARPRSVLPRSVRAKSVRARSARRRSVPRRSARPRSVLPRRQARRSVPVRSAPQRSAPPRSVLPRRQDRRSVPVRSAPPRSVLPRRQARRSVPVRLLSDPERSDPLRRLSATTRRKKSRPPSRRPGSGCTNGRLGMGRRVVSGLRPQKTARLLQQRYRASSSPTEFWTKTAALNPLVYASSTPSLTECSSALHVRLAQDQTANHLMHRTSWYQKVMVWNSSAVRERMPAVRRPQRPPMHVSDSARVRPERPKRRKTFTGCHDWVHGDLGMVHGDPSQQQCEDACKANSRCHQAVWEAQGPWRTECWLGTSKMDRWNGKGGTSRNCDRAAQERGTVRCVDHCFSKKGWWWRTIHG